VEITKEFVIAQVGFNRVIAAPAVLFASKPAAIYELKDQTAVSMLLRAQRNW
jgi:hypothetical protein